MISDFKFRHLEQLSEEQESVLQLPSDQNVVIEGGPGTGKTYLAVSRAESLSRQGLRTLLLVQSRLLMRRIQEVQPKTSWETVEFYTINADGSYDYHDFNSYYNVYTYMSWISEMYLQRFGEHYPLIGRDCPDWETIEKQLSGLGRIYDQIIVDEGQDFPAPLLRSLRSLAATVTVFIDPFQAMESTKTSTNVAAYVLSADVYHLSINYRCTREINTFSCLYRGKDDVLPNEDAVGTRPVLISCKSSSEQIEKIKEIILASKGRSIGIILDTRPARVMWEELKMALKWEMPVQLYQPRSYRDFDFETEGVKIVSYGNVKGLEFDIVILPSFTRVASTGSSSADLARIHIATSRAKEQLLLFEVKEETSYSSKWIDTKEILSQNKGSFVKVN